MSLTLHADASRGVGRVPAPVLSTIEASPGAREIVAILLRHRLKLLWALVVPPVLAVILLLVLPPVYRAQADLMVKTGHEYLASAEVGDAGLTAPTSTKQEGINSEIALMGERAVIQGAIDAIGLKNLYPGLVEDPPLFTSVDEAAVQAFTKDLDVEPVKLSNVITVTFEAASPKKAQDVLDRFIQVYIAKHREVFAGNRSEGFDAAIQTELRHIDELEAERTRLKLASGVYDIGAQRSALIGQRVEAQGRLQDLLGNQTTLTRRIAYLDSARPAIPATTRTTNADKSDESVHAREALTDLRQQEAAIASRFGSTSPDLQRVRAQMADLQRSIASTSSTRTSVGTAPSSLRQQVDQELVMANAELAPIRSEIDRFRALLATYDGELHRLEQADLALRTIGSRIDAMNDDLKGLQGRYEQARTEEQTDLAKQVSVVQVAPALAPDKPASPKKVIFLAAGLLLGLMSSGALALLLILTNKVVVTEAAVQRLIGLPVLATIPLSPTPRQR